MRLDLHKILGLSGTLMLLSGCGGKDSDPVAPPPPAPQATKVDIGAPASAAVTAPAPPTGGAPLAPVPISPPAAMKDDDLLGGNGRPLTEEEKMLLSYGVNMFKDEKGRYPANLQEAVTSHHITRLPKLPPGEEFNYDPATGKITVIKK